jgi:hypothetical protein
MLRVLQLMTPYRIFVEESVVVFQEHHPGIIEPWETCAVYVSPASQRFLSLRTGMTPAELRAMLSSYGLVSPEGSVAEWRGQAGMITMTNLPQEQGRLAELLFLVDQGYAVTGTQQGAARGSGMAPVAPGQ